MLQTTIVILIVAFALAFIARQIYRSFAPKSRAGCAGGCGCGHETAEIKPAQPTQANAEPKPATVFFSAEDLARRAKIRKA